MSNDNKKDSHKEVPGLSMRRSSSQESTASTSSSLSSSLFLPTTSATTTPTKSEECIKDAVAAIIFCDKHKKFALTKIKQKGCWFAFTIRAHHEGSFEAIVHHLKSILTIGEKRLSFSTPEFKHILNIQMPFNNEFITRTLFSTQLTHNNDEKYSSKCCQSNKFITWYSENEMKSLQNIWGKEVNVFIEAALNPNEFSISPYVEVSLKEVKKFVPKENATTTQEILLNTAKYNEREVDMLFLEFIQQTFPSQYMSISSFVDYIKKYSVVDENLLKTYFLAAAAEENEMHSMGFHQFLFLLASLEKHSDGGQIRARFIFRFYAQKDGHKMTIQEFKKFTHDALKNRLNSSPNEKTVDAEMRHYYNQLGIHFGESVDEKLFVTKFGSLEAKGTNGLFRASKSPIDEIRKNPTFKYNIISTPSSGKGIDPRPQPTRYTLATHSVTLSLNGMIVSPQKIGEKDAKRMQKEKRIVSKSAFDENNAANIILNHMRKNSRHLMQGINIWTKKSEEFFVKQMIILCSEAEKMFKNEERVIHVKEPCFVFGDIHGNLHDLLIYEKNLWKKGPICEAANYLFLGDFVDRGSNGIECILYLFAFKVISPEKYFLIRGNHEMREIQKLYTFYNECKSKLGSNADQVWESINRVFDCLPFAAIIDGSIFACHGGIPASVTDVKQLLSIEVPLSEPQSVPCVWEILWNDPINESDVPQFDEMQTNGFLQNLKRGTAYYYSSQAVERFLHVNSLTHIIRAHEMIPSGVEYHFGGKVITIFSSSRYENANNESACLLIQQKKIRIIQIKTY